MQSYCNRAVLFYRYQVNLTHGNWEHLLYQDNPEKGIYKPIYRNCYRML